ncbi:MAG: helix-hairpin-helix domain-containing protein [candidate division WOR-3 bacterium]|nr:MAG: helix-hairpin-helix domain-containing protein [candidate division WOR-3 bacterium]
MALVWALVCLLKPEWWELPPGAVPDEDVRALEETVSCLQLRPVELNRARVDELLDIPWLNPVLAHRVAAYRDSAHGFQSIGELRRVGGMTDEWFRALAPLLTTQQAGPGWSGDVALRAGIDSVGSRPERLRTFGRARVKQGQWTGAALVEHDPGEAGIVDWSGLGLGWQGRSVSVVGGDFTFGSGLGLVFSGPHRRAGSAFGEDVKGPGNLRLLSSALETRALRGLGADIQVPGWTLTVLGSHSGQDAKLNPDGTVERLRGDGVYDDSASKAERNTVNQTAAGASVTRLWRGVAVTGNGAFVRYSREFAPGDSADSFSGRALGCGGVSAELRTEDYRLGLEGAASSGGGAAGALDLAGEWSGLSAGLGLHGYQTRYFAPLGRTRSLVDREPRLYGRARLGLRAAGFRVWLRGNTYRDFSDDSLPARVELSARQELGRLSLGCNLGRSYKLEQPRSRDSRLSLSWDIGRLGIEAVVGDEYPELTAGRGRMAGLLLRADLQPVRLGFSAARFDILGSGVRMSMREPDLSRAGSGFSTGVSAWRLATGLSLGIVQRVAVSAKAGATWREAFVLDAAGQVELALN